MKRSGEPVKWQRLMAIVLVLWWAGFNCLIGCVVAMPGHCGAGAAIKAAKPAQQDAQTLDCCASDRHCAESGDGAATLEPAPEPPSAPELDCCALENHQAKTERGPRLGAESGGVRATRSVHSSDQAAARIEAASGAQHLPDRGATHIRLCLFRI